MNMKIEILQLKHRMIYDLDILMINKKYQFKIDLNKIALELN